MKEKHKKILVAEHELKNLVREKGIEAAAEAKTISEQVDIVEKKVIKRQFTEAMLEK